MPRPLTKRDLADVNGQTARQIEQCSVDSPATRCTAKVGAQVRPPSGAEWPIIVQGIIDWCQAPGRSLRDSSRIKADVVCTLVGAFIWPSGDDAVSSVVQRTISDLWDAGGEDFDLGGLLGAWNAQAGQILATDRERALNVLAVRSVLKAIMDQTVSYDRSQHKSDDRGLTF